LDDGLPVGGQPVSGTSSGATDRTRTAAIGIVRLVARLLRAQYLLSGQPFSIGGFYRALLGRTVQIAVHCRDAEGAEKKIKI
jgi:hypothetical protein